MLGTCKFVEREIANTLPCEIGLPDCNKNVRRSEGLSVMFFLN